jgi:hypothetical protein
MCRPRKHHNIFMGMEFEDTTGWTKIGGPIHRDFIIIPAQQKARLSSLQLTRQPGSLPKRDADYLTSTIFFECAFPLATIRTK